MKTLRLTPTWRRMDTLGLMLMVLALGLLFLAKCTDVTRPPGPPPVYVMDPLMVPPPDLDSAVASILAGDPDNFTPPRPCWPLSREGCEEWALAHTIRATAEWYGVRPTRIARLIWVESRGDPLAQGRPIRVRVGNRWVWTRAVGLGQIVPELWEGVYPECGQDLFQVRTNVCYTVRIWKYYRQTHHPDLHASLLAYNGCRRPSCSWYASSILGY